MSSIQSHRMKMQRKRAEAIENPTVIKVDSDRYLTSGEIAMAKLVFKNSIDYSKVKIINSGFLGIPTLSNSAMTPFGHIHFPSKDYVANPDFSVAKATDKHWFMHEMTHVWQHQLGFKNFDVGLCHGFSLGYILSATTPDTPKEGDLKSYATDIRGADANKKFHEFNFEQQGRIIEFWFDACYLQNEQADIRPHHQRSLKLLGYVERILRDFLHNPHDKRLLPKNIL